MSDALGSWLRVAVRRKRRHAGGSTVVQYGLIATITSLFIVAGFMVIQPKLHGTLAVIATSILVNTRQ